MAKAGVDSPSLRSDRLVGGNAVPPTVPHTELIANARREIRALKRPVGVQRNTWTGVIDILRLIAGYLPEPYPSQRTIAAKLDLHRTTVTRRLALAERLGLIRRTDRPNPGGLMDGTNYHFACFSEGLAAALARTRFQDTNCTQTQNSYSVGVQRTHLPVGAPGVAESAPTEAEVIPLPNRDDSWDIRHEHVNYDGSRPQDFEATTVEGADPAVRLAFQFERKWAAAKRAHSALRVSRGKYSVGMMIGYIRNSMLTECTPEHVEAYMDAFIEAAASGDVEIKKGQFAFERFTAWWGREDVEDPAERASNRAIAQDAIARARAIRAERGLTNG